MRKILFFFAVVSLCFGFLAGQAWAEPFVHLSHTLTGYTEGADTVTLDYVLHVENAGGTPLYNLSLSYVPLMLVSESEFSLTIDALDAYGVLDVPFSFVTPMLLTQDEVLEQPLFWAGEGQDANYNFIDFPAESLSTTGGGV